ncbi:hypothetical protein FA95DRAFT_1609066 [Auriscalpium vulgare]|uniref:Uncharacterized protein n=1 Tax=Auriscalpium vulgare TaxID=40419 RepID=A0ACB8RJK1_9AGAM|nr:hypothetical protein FA95DRAFT_1609066 [Auriscalpium vulgare]
MKVPEDDPERTRRRSRAYAYTFPIPFPLTDFIVGQNFLPVPSEIHTFGSIEAGQEALSTGRIGQAWAANYTTAARLPLHGSLGQPNDDYPPPDGAQRLPAPVEPAAYSFVHGELAPDYPDLAPFSSPGLPDNNATPAERMLYGSDGPLWYRGWALDEEEVVCNAVGAALEKTGTRRMIMGHTYNKTSIVSRWGGQIIGIDTGISHAFGGVLSALSVYDSLTPLAPSSDGQAQWTETEFVKAVYEDHEHVLVDEEREVVGDF